MCAVVKADGYGHGAPQVAKVALDNGASCLAVATVEEAVQIRDEGISAPVLLLTEPPEEDLEEVVGNRITPTLYRRSTVAAVTAHARRLRQMTEVHLKVDSGMHRVGAPPQALLDLVNQVADSAILRLEGVWSHFAVADTDPLYTRRQTETFLGAMRKAQPILAGQGLFPSRHLANTPGILLHPESHLEMVRPGLGIYGLYPHPDCREIIDLRPAMKIVTHVGHLLRHPPGARPSYGRIRPLQKESVVAMLPVGYADGVPRLISGRGEALIGGCRFPLAGRVTMDQLLVEVGDHPVSVGDEAILVGTQGKESITFDDWARLADTINYEVVSRIGPRLPRRYIS
jgi:alanine racemase